MFIKPDRVAIDMIQVIMRQQDPKFTLDSTNHLSLSSCSKNHQNVYANVGVLFILGNNPKCLVDLVLVLYDSALELM